MEANEKNQKQQMATVTTTLPTSSAWAYGRSEYLLALLTAIPTGIGKKLRQAVYPSIFKYFDKRADVGPNVRFVRPTSVSIGHSCTICRYSVLNCWEDAVK